MSLKFDEQPKKLSDIPVYSEIKESSEMFENQACSTNTLVNAHRTVKQENSYDVLETSTLEEKSKKDQCERN